MSDPQVLETWRSLGGRTYSVGDIKEPYLIPLIEGLEYPAKHPIAIDVGSGVEGMAERAYVNGRYLPAAMIDIALSNSGQMIGDCEEFAVDIDALTAGTEPERQRALSRYLSEQSETGEPLAELVVFSDILNYIDYKRAIRWFNQRLKIGGFVVVANKPGRGFSDYFSSRGVRNNDRLIAYCTDGLGMELQHEQYPFAVNHDTCRDFLLAAFRKVIEPPEFVS